MSWTTPGQGYFKSNLNLNESIQSIMKIYPRENINTISALRDIAGGRGRDEGRTADAIANKFISYMMHVSQTDKQLYAKYKKMNFKDLFKKNLNTFKKTKGGDVFKIKSGSLKEETLQEDAAAAADLKAKQAVEAERLKDKQESENDALKMKHERENEQQKKKDESEKEAEKNQAARESVNEVSFDSLSPADKTQMYKLLSKGMDLPHGSPAFKKNKAELDKLRKKLKLEGQFWGQDGMSNAIINKLKKTHVKLVRTKGGNYESATIPMKDKNKIAQLKRDGYKEVKKEAVNEGEKMIGELNEAKMPFKSPTGWSFKEEGKDTIVLTQSKSSHYPRPFTRMTKEDFKLLQKVIRQVKV